MEVHKLQPPFSLNLYRIDDICRQLQFNEKNLLKILDNPLNHIRKFHIKTKNDKEREIINPSSNYKKLLQKLNKLLQIRSNFYDEVYGGIKNKSVSDAVGKHCAQECYFQTDIKDFFPSINFKRVINVFLKANCKKEIANLLATLVTYEERIPLGFPTSPIIANAVCVKLDFDLINIAHLHRLKYSRWIDDITFSGRIKDVKNALYKIESTIEKNGFVQNTEKTKLSYRNKKVTEVLGLNINKHKPYVPSYLINSIENILVNYSYLSEYELKVVFPELSSSKNILNTIDSKIKYIEKFNKADASYLKELLGEVKKNAL